MMRDIRGWSWRGAWIVAVAAALAFGTGEAVAGVKPLEYQDRCTDWCYARYHICMSNGGADCYTERQACVKSCSLNP